MNAGGQWIWTPLQSSCLCQLFTTTPRCVTSVVPCRPDRAGWCCPGSVLSHTAPHLQGLPRRRAPRAPPLSPMHLMTRRHPQMARQHPAQVLGVPRPTRTAAPPHPPPPHSASVPVPQRPAERLPLLAQLLPLLALPLEVGCKIVLVHLHMITCGPSPAVQQPTTACVTLYVSASRVASSALLAQPALPRHNLLQVTPTQLPAHTPGPHLPRLRTMRRGRAASRCLALLATGQSQGFVRPLPGASCLAPAVARPAQVSLWLPCGVREARCSGPQARGLLSGASCLADC